jgi:hypothetical protein
MPNAGQVFAFGIAIAAMNRIVRFYLAVSMLAAVIFGIAGCGKSTTTGDAGAAHQTSGLEKAAQENALAEIKKHWIKQPEGWITARDSGTSFAPIRFLRQCRELSVEGVRSDDLSEADRMNGFEWTGEVKFKETPCREAGEQGVLLDGMAGITIFRQRGRWTQWVDFTPEPLKLQRVKGQWQIPQDTWLLRGKLPGAEDFATAGVK